MAPSENRSVKTYKIETTVNGTMDCIYATLTDYDHYTDMYKQMSEFRILSKSDSLMLSYTVISMPWPFDDRDVLTEVRTEKSDSKITLNSTLSRTNAVPVSSKLVRITDYDETYTIEKTGETQNKVTLIGHADIGGSIPDWVQNLFIIDSPMSLMKQIKEKCEK